MPGGVLQRSNIHLAVCAPGEVTRTLGALKASPATQNPRNKIKFILATDGETIEAEDLSSNEGATVACPYAELPNHFGFFLPLAGITTVAQIRENAFDIRGTGRLNRLYVEHLKDNPDWRTAERRHDMNSNDYKDLIYAATKQEVEAKRKAFIRKWRLKCRAVADRLEEAGDKLFTFTRFPQSQWKSIRTSNAIERLHEEFKRRIKTQTLLPCAETAAMLFWALMASGQIVMRKVDGWQSFAEKPAD